MLHSIIHQLLKRRHFWRYATFSEVSELYASRALRISAQTMIGVFAAIYLYQNGYSLVFIGIYFAIHFLLRALYVIPLAYLIARVGPKHSILISNLLSVVALMSFIFVPQIGMPALIIFAVIQSLSTTLYQLSYEIDFSKVTHIDHSGKELGYMNIVEKIAAGLSPLLGGVIAFLLGPQATILTAGALYMLAALPLLRTGELIRTHQHITFVSLPFRAVWRQMVAASGVGVDFIVTTQIWQLFIVIAVLGTTSNVMYAQIGAFGSVTLFAALIISYVFGKLIDEHRGKELLKYAVILSAMTHIARPFVATPFGVVTTNVLNEVASTGYNMPFMRGMFDMADRLSGFRIAYLCCQMMALCMGASVAALWMVVAVTLWGDITGFYVIFATASLAVLLIRTHRFPLYRK